MVVVDNKKEIFVLANRVRASVPKICDNYQFVKGVCVVEDGKKWFDGITWFDKKL